jgi:hypothetical protein
MHIQNIIVHYFKLPDLQTQEHLAGPVERFLLYKQVPETMQQKIHSDQKHWVQDVKSICN